MAATSWLYELDGGAQETFYVPLCRVEVGPEAGSLRAVNDVVKVTYKDAINQIDSFEFTINGGTWSPGTARYADRLPGQAPDPDAPPSLLPGACVRLWLGYSKAEQLRPMLTGKITQVTPSLSADAGVSVTVRALSTLEKMRDESESKRWPVKKGATIRDSEIAQALARANDATAVVPNLSNESPLQTMLQANETDIALLVRRARARGYIVFFREVTPKPAGKAAGEPKKVIYFGPSNMLGPAELSQLGERTSPYRLAWGSSLIDFRPSINISTTLWRSANIQFWDRRTKQNPKISWTLDQMWRREPGLNSDLRDLVEPVVVVDKPISDTAVHTAGEATDLVRNALRENFLQMVTGDGTSVGRPDLRAASRVAVAGVGAPFDGSWFLTTSTHTFDDNGYRTQFTARREQSTTGAS